MAPAPAEAAAAEAVPPAEDAGDAAEAAPEPAAEAEAGLTPEVPAPAVAEIKGESTASVKTVTFAPDLLSPPEDAAKPLLADTPSDVWCTPRGALKGPGCCGGPAPAQGAGRARRPERRREEEREEEEPAWHQRGRSHDRSRCGPKGARCALRGALFL